MMKVPVYIPLPFVFVIVKPRRTTVSSFSRQFRNDDELHADQNLEIENKPVCKDFNIYVKAKLGSHWAVYDKELKEAHIASEKRAHNSNELSQRCLDAMALLGDIKPIPDAEEALKRKDYHRCFLAVDNYYMRLGGQDVGRFREKKLSRSGSNLDKI